MLFRSSKFINLHIFSPLLIFSVLLNTLTPIKKCRLVFANQHHSITVLSEMQSGTLIPFTPAAFSLFFPQTRIGQSFVYPQVNQKFNPQRQQAKHMTMHAKGKAPHHYLPQSLGNAAHFFSESKLLKTFMSQSIPALAGAPFSVHLRLFVNSRPVSHDL